MRWEDLDEKGRSEAVKKALLEHVDPMLQRDGGGVQLVGVDGYTVKIAYQGACVGCPMALHGTLSFIQETLRAHLHDELVVVPSIMPCET